MDTTNTQQEPTRENAVLACAFPCKNCGHQMAFSPKYGSLYCSYCHSKEAIESPVDTAPEYVYDPERDAYSAPRWEGKETSLICPSCGAETVVFASSMTASCPFCDARYVTAPQEKTQTISPETMTPFQVEEKEAQAKFADFIQKKLFAPRAFKRADFSPRFCGVYVPMWTYDAEIATAYSGRGGRRRTETYTVHRDGKTEVRTRVVVDWFPISGAHEASFDDVPCPATRHLDTGLFAKVGPYSMKVLHRYNPAYLAGFMAERYNVGLGEGFALVKRRMERNVERQIENALSYDVYDAMHYRHRYKKVLFKHILLPLWTATYRYRDKVYRFFVNGETGKYAGTAPVSGWKIAALCLGIFAAGILIALLASLAK